MRKDVTRLSSKGQVVIPAWIRREFGLTTGEELQVEPGPAGERSIVLRSSGKQEIERLLEKGYRWIESTGVDLVEDLHAARRKERERNRAARRP